MQESSLSCGFGCSRGPNPGDGPALAASQVDQNPSCFGWRSERNNAADQYCAGYCQQTVGRRGARAWCAVGRSVQPGLGENFLVQLRSRRSDPRHGRSSTCERRLPDWTNRVVTTREIARFPSNDLVMTCTGNPPYAGREDLQLVGVARFVDTAAWPVSFRVRTARGPQPAGVMRNSDGFAAEHPSTPRRCGLLSMAAGPIAPRLVNARKVGRRP